IKSDHVRVAFLTTQIGKERERRVLSQARQAAANGNFEQALSALDGTAPAGKRSALVDEARQQPEQKQLHDRVTDPRARAAERTRDGQFVEAAEDNARFFIESARALATNRPEVQQAQRQLHDALIAQIRTVLSAGNAASAQQWIDIAAESGV